MKSSICSKQKKILRNMLLGTSVLFVLCILSACQSVQIRDWPLISRLWPDEDVGARSGTEITLMGWSTDEATDQKLQTLINQFNAEQPDVHATLLLVQNYEDMLRSAWAENAPPDLFFADSFQMPTLLQENRISAISAHAAQSAYSLQIDAFYPPLLDAFTLNGTLYCLPSEFSTLALLYNKELFDKAQISYPTSTWSWPDLRTAAEAITKIPTTFFGVSGLALTPDFSRWVPFLWQAGGSVMNETGTAMAINSPEALEAMNFYLDLVLDGAAVEPQNISSSWNGEAFGKGRVGMIIEGNWVIPYLEQEFPNLDYGVAPLPTGPKGKATLAFSHCYAVSSATPNADAAFQLALYLTSQEAMQWLGEQRVPIPARVALQAEWRDQHADLQPFVDGITYAHPWRFGPDFQDVVVAVNASMQQVFDAEISAEEVLRVADVMGADALASD